MQPSLWSRRTCATCSLYSKPASCSLASPSRSSSSGTSSSSSCTRARALSRLACKAQNNQRGGAAFPYKSLGYGTVYIAVMLLKPAGLEPDEDEEAGIWMHDACALMRVSSSAHLMC